MKKSIRAKLTLLVAVIIVLVIIVQLGFDLSYAEDYFIQEKSSQIEKFYDKLKEAIADNDVDQMKTLADIYEKNIIYGQLFGVKMDKTYTLRILVSSVHIRKIIHFMINLL